MIKQLSLCLAVFFAASAPGPAKAAQKVPATALHGEVVDDEAKRLDRALHDAVTQAGIVGLSTAVIVDGRIVWTRAYGLADREGKVPLTPETPMRVASIAKTMIGITMMRLVAEGRLDLDKDINVYLPFRVVNPHYPEATITLRHLATHTSSITDRRDFYASLYRPIGEPRVDLHELLADYLVPGGASYQASNFLEVPPGASRDYSNLAATLAAYIVERVSGESFDAHTERVIFAPLALRTARWTGISRNGASASELYAQDEAATRRIEPYALASYPDGGLEISGADLARYFATLMGDGSYDWVRVIEPVALAEMKRFQWSAERKPVDFDLADGNSGLFWRTKFSGRRIGHGGNDTGVSAEMLTDSKGRVGIVMISNTSLHGEANLQLMHIIDALTAYGEAIAAQTTSFELEEKK